MKKILTVILVTLIVLLPTIAGAVIHFMPDEIIQTSVNLSGTFLDENGNGFEFNRNSNSFLASFFDELDENSSKSFFRLDNISYDKIYEAEVIKKDKKQRFTLYLSLVGGCYYADGSGDLYRIDTSYANTLLNSKYAIALYEENHTPALLTYSNQTVLPESAELQYTVKNGDSIPGTGAGTANETLTYYSSKTATISFTVQPDICWLKAYVNGRLYHDGYLYNFDPSSLPSRATVKYEIDATWTKTNANDCFGDAHYSFYISYAPAPVFTVENIENEFLVVKAQNVTQPESITCKLSTGKVIDLSFHRSEDNYFALIPTATLLDAGKHKLIFNCGETSKSLELEITKPDFSVSSKVYTPKSPITAQMLSDMNALIAKIGSQSSNDSPSSDAFINIETEYADDFSLTLGYGKIRSFTEGESLNMIGVEFSGLNDMDIPALNGGVVCAVGEDAVLGKYAVIDHGYGLKSWYCNISEATVQVGAHISRGDTVAKSGNSAIYDQTGFYLITTIGGSPVSPYAVYENNFTLPQ